MDRIARIGLAVRRYALPARNAGAHIGLLLWVAVKQISLETWRLVRPTAAKVLYVNVRKIKDVDFDEQRNYWRGAIGAEDQRVAVQIAYETAVARQAQLESKAVGILQAGGIVAAGALVAVASGDMCTSLLGLGAVFYLAAAALATSHVLIPAPRRAMLIDDAVGEDSAATMAACASTMQPLGIRTANLITSGAVDLGRAALLTLVALLKLAL